MKLQELFTDVTKWTHGNLANDNMGCYVDAVNPTAVCWCLFGGIEKCYPNNSDEIANKVIEFIKTKTNFLSTIPKESMPDDIAIIFDYNDSLTTTFADIKNLIKELDI